MTAKGGFESADPALEIEQKTGFIVNDLFYTKDEWSKLEDVQNKHHPETKKIFASDTEIDYEQMLNFTKNKKHIDVIAERNSVI